MENSNLHASQDEFSTLYAQVQAKYDTNLEPLATFSDSIMPAVEMVYQKYIIVSHGSPNPKCGDVRAKLYCEQTGKFLHDLLHTCHRAVCPICWTSWIGRETDVASERFMVGLDLLRQEYTGYQVHHVVFSAPLEDYHLTPKQLRTRLNYRMKKAGVVAGLVIFHAYRFRNNRTKESVTWRHCSLNPNAEVPIVDCEEYYSPHFHVASVGYLMNVEEFYEKFGWRYRKVRPLRNLDDLRGMIWYALSHAGIAEGHHAVTWVGRFSTNSLIKDGPDEVEVIFPKCPCCKGNIIKEYVKDDWSEYGCKIQEVYSLKITRRHYKFKDG